MRLKSKGTIIVSAVVIIVITSFLASSCGEKRTPRTSGASPSGDAPVARTLPPLPVRPLSKELKALRAGAMRQASELRELEWRGEVGMAELSGWEYGSRTSEIAQSLGGEELRALGRLASAGGVLPEGTDLASLAASFTAVSAGATYSPLDKQILLVDRHSGSSLLTHEFVHALQDQHFDLLKLLVVRPYNLDRTEAVFALIEGDAMNVQRRAEEGEAYTRRTLEDITRQENERFGQYRQELGAFFPPLLTETFIFRYRDGARFVETVRRKSGQRGVDELFARPPASSEQILHPEKYLQNEAPRDVQLNEAAFAESGWRAVVSTAMGEIGVRGVLMAGVPEREAVRAAAGWGGDRAYLFENGNGGRLFVWKSAWDKRSDAEELFKAYNALQHRRKGVQPGGESSGGDEAQMTWREGGMMTLVYLTGENIIVMRGAEADVNAAFATARG
jgi:hypothetical protein